MGPSTGLTHEAVNEGVVSFPKDLKDESDLKDTGLHDSLMFCCWLCVIAI